MREWRGLKDTMIDYHFWLRNWRLLLVFVFKSNPVKVVKAIFRYRWFYGYLHIHDLVDRCTAGTRGTALKVTNLLFSAIIEDFTGTLHDMLCHSDKCVIIDAFMPNEIFKAMDLTPHAIEAAPYLFGVMVNQHLPAHYLDVVESYGVSADTCPLPSGTAGIAIANDFIKAGICVVSSNLPCDGGLSSKAVIGKRLQMPTHILDIPLRNDDEWANEFMKDELKEMIKFVEEQSGQKMDWDKLREVCETYNKQAEYELEKWEINRTDYPQVTGPALWLYRYYSYQLAPGSSMLLKVDKKVNKLIQKGYKNKEICTKKPKYRAVLWGAPANYDPGFMRWCENAWGISVLMDFESYTSTELIDTSTSETMLEGLANHYLNITMVRHTTGGYENIMEDLWQICEEYRVDFVIMENHISCKGVGGLMSVIQEEARKRNIKMCNVDNDLMDCRTFSRQDMRDDVNKFMFNIMKATPVDERLLEMNDQQSW